MNRWASVEVCCNTPYLQKGPQNPSPRVCFPLTIFSHKYSSLDRNVAGMLFYCIHGCALTYWTINFCSLRCIHREWSPHALWHCSVVWFITQSLLSLINNLAEARCYGISRAGQLLSNRVAVETDWNVRCFDRKDLCQLQCWCKPFIKQ